MSREDMSHKDLLRAERRSTESFVRTYTRHGKPLPKLTDEEITTMEFFNSIQRTLERERLQAIYEDHDE